MTPMKKRLALMGLLLIIISALTLYFTVDLGAIRSLTSLNYQSLVLAFIALALGMYFDGLRLQRLVRMGGYHLPIQAVLRVIFGNYFMAVLTPGASGGAVAQVLILKSYGVDITKGTPIVLIRTVFSIMFLVCMLPLVFFYDSLTIPYISKESLLFISFSLLILVVLLMYMISLQGFRSSVEGLLRKIVPVKAEGVIATFDRIAIGLGILFENPKQSLLVFLESAISLVCLYAIAPALMLAFSGEIPVVDVLGRMIVLNLILYFAPTPGGAGVAEGLFVFFFSPFLPEGTSGILAIAWRFVAEYVPFLIGMYGVLTLYGQQFVARAENSTNKE